MSLALLFVLVVLASYRAWRFVGLDDFPPATALRVSFTAWVQRHYGTAWADGVACQWCSGWWVCCAVVGVVWALHPLPLPGLWFLAVNAGVGLIGNVAD